MKRDTMRRFDMSGKVCVITGAAGLLGPKHAEALLDASASVVLVDINGGKLEETRRQLAETYPTQYLAQYILDITKEEDIKNMIDLILAKFGRIDVLINNAANNPAVTKDGSGTDFVRLENFPLDVWNKDIEVNLTGAFLMSKHIGSHMAVSGGGVILNIASELGVIAPDQRIYRKPGLESDQQPVKPVTYSVAKHGLIGLTKYLATYWADKNIRVNSLSPGGVYNNQPEEFVRKLTDLIPIGRMADIDECKAAVLFLCSDASSFMTGANLLIDGGRTCW